VIGGQLPLVPAGRRCGTQSMTSLDFNRLWCCKSNLPQATQRQLFKAMPTISIVTSATISPAAAHALFSVVSPRVAQCVGCPTGHVHIEIRGDALMTWGSVAGGFAGAPHTAQVRVLTAGAPLTVEVKRGIVAAVLSGLEQHAPRASTQIFFQSSEIDALAIDGLLLPDLIARDAPPAAANE
jgi:hypothetical protein